MNKTRIARFAGVAAGVALALSFATSAGAQTMTIAQLQAQIAALMAQLQAMQGGATVTVTFTRNLTVGSTGSDVSSLQQVLHDKGYLSVNPTGYFGALTKAAVARWQASAGLPATGYFGPLSRAAIVSVVVTTPGGTTTGGTVTTGGGITTPGKEGVLTITAGPLSNTVANVGATMIPVITVRAQAQNSDIDVQRVTVDLGTNTNIYNKIYSKLYLVDAATGNVLASQNLNSSTVIQSGTNYITTIAGFHFIVPAGSIRDIQVKADLYSSIDSRYISGGANAVNTSITIPVNGVRGVDGAGVDQFGPTSSFSQSVTINASLIDNATAQVAIAPSTPLKNSLAVTDTVNGQMLQVPVMAFNVTATNDTLHLHQVAVTFVGSPTNSTTATATTAYLYNGSTQIASASINSSTGVATFSNITDGTAGATIPANTTVTFTIKADVTGVTAGSLDLSASVTTGSTVIYNSQDGTVTITGSAAGQIQTILGKGPVFSLVSSSISKGQTSGGTNGAATTTLSAVFNVQVQAVGSDILFGSQASTSPFVTLGLYKGGSLTTTYSTNSSSTSLSLPSAGIVDTTGTNQTWRLPQNTTVTIPVNFIFTGRDSTGAAVAVDNYSVGVEKFQWVVASTGTAGSTTFPSGQQAWRTSTVALP